MTTNLFREGESSPWGSWVTCTGSWKCCCKVWFLPSGNSTGRLPSDVPLSGKRRLHTTLMHSPCAECRTWRRASQGLRGWHPSPLGYSGCLSAALPLSTGPAGLKWFSSTTSCLSTDHPPPQAWNFLRLKQSSEKPALGKDIRILPHHNLQVKSS